MPKLTIQESRDDQPVFTLFPLFGKANIKRNDLFGGWAYSEDGRSSMAPVIRSGQATVRVAFANNVGVFVFSNGSEADSWIHWNCGNCTKYKQITDPSDLRSGGCQLELRISYAYMGDGRIPFKTVRRIGYHRLSIGDNGIHASLGNCLERVEKQADNG